jgi:hypothetical protein
MIRTGIPVTAVEWEIFDDFDDIFAFGADRQLYNGRFHPFFLPGTAVIAPAAGFLTKTLSSCLAEKAKQVLRGC